ncbi:DUF6941 family protein [Luteimonas sp. A277]
MRPYAHAVYCDDIREEVGGKSTLVGVYHGSLMVQSFPATLPKLCVVLQVVLPAENLPEGLKMRVMLDEELLAEGEMAVRDLEAALAAIPTEVERSKPSEEKGWVVAANFIFAPMKLEGPGMIRAWVEAGDQEMKANGLRIAQMQQLPAS